MINECEKSKSVWSVKVGPYHKRVNFKILLKERVVKDIVQKSDKSEKSVEKHAVIATS